MSDGHTTHGPISQPGTVTGRYVDSTAAGTASFRCAACREVAAVVKLAPAEQPVEMGPPLGAQNHPRNGIVIDYWLGSTCWQAVDADTWASVSEVLTTGRPTPPHCTRSTGNWHRSTAASAKPATAAATGTRSRSGTARSTTTPKATA